MLKDRRNIVSPLKEKDLHLFFCSNETEKDMKYIIESINKNIYGCHLIGGLRGSGKSSFVNLCCDPFEGIDMNIILRIDLSENDTDSSILRKIIRELYLSKSDRIITSELIESIDALYNRTFYDIKSIIKTEIYANKEQSNIVSEKNDYFLNFFGNLPIISQMLKSQINLSEQEQFEEKDVEQKITHILNEMAELFDDDLRRIELINVFRKFNEDGYRVFLIFDEIDKCSSEKFEYIFNTLKSIVLNERLISFFIVGYDDYIKYSTSNYLTNPLSTYFITRTYIPTFDFELLKKYTLHVLGKRNLFQLQKLYYQTYGLIRNINMNEYSNYKFNRFDETNVFPLIFTDVIKSIENKYKNFEIDACKTILKEIMEQIYRRENISIEELLEFIDGINGIKSIKQEDYLIMLNSLIDVSKEYFNVFGLRFKEGKQIISFNRKHKKLVQDLIMKKEEEDIHTDEYKCLLEVDKSINTYTSRFSKSNILIKINEGNGFRKLRDVIEASIMEINRIVIVKKRIQAFGRDEFEYSGILFCNRTVGNVAYLAEDCSWSYEKANRLDNFLGFVKSLKINPLIIEIDDMCIQSNFDYIAEVIESEL